MWVGSLGGYLLVRRVGVVDICACLVSTCDDGGRLLVDGVPSLQIWEFSIDMLLLEIGSTDYLQKKR